MSLYTSVMKGVVTLHRKVFDASGGRVLGKAAGMPVVKLTTTGRKSGQQRDTMLTAPIADAHRVVLVASYGGADHHPAWFLNLRDDPKVTVTVGGAAHDCVARIAGPDERAALWRELTSAHANYAGYQSKTAREIPVVVCEF